ncbi:MAG: MOSC domain-containing protein [Dictyoglomaceae bacterium]
MENGKERPKVISVNISEKRGTVKVPVNEIELLVDEGVKGDAHAKKGGKRQVSLLAWESIEKMRKILPNLTYGSFAENITIEGLELHTLKVGTKLIIGEVELEITEIGKECHVGCEIMKLVGNCIMPKEGVFAKVIKGGKIRPGEEIEIIEN